MKEFTEVLAELHVKSQDFSPNGQYGFQVTTNNGPTPQYTKWTDSWEEFFSEHLKDLFRQDAARRPDPCPEMDALMIPLFEKVIPRLLRPLETGGNNIRPSLIHGDLWHGNTARFSATGKPAIFDACSLWAHSEADLHNWRGGRFVFDKQYILEYFKYNPPSEPKDEWEDRNDLYLVTSQLFCSIAWYKAPRYREECVANMKALVEKFGDGYTGPHQRKGTTVGYATERTDSAAPVNEPA